MKPVRQRDHSGIRYTGKAGTDHGLGQLFRLAAQVAAGIGHILGTGVGTPAFGGHIVVGAGVHHAVAVVGVGQVIAGFPAVKGKLHDLHARVAAGRKHGLDLRGQVAKILGNDAALAKVFVHGVDKIAVRAFFPVAARRRFVPGGNGVIALEAAEVVDAHHIVNGGGVLHALLPPRKAGGFVRGPVIQGVAP